VRGGDVGSKGGVGGFEGGGIHSKLSRQLLLYGKGGRSRREEAF